MTETTPDAEDKTAPVSSNLAVVRCCEAYVLAYKDAKKQERSDYGASLFAAKAFRAAMPSLSGSDNIRNFIACVAHGMLLGAIEGPDGARLLYAAQVAHTTTVRTQSPPPKSRSK
jgi:hypothetical protein